MMLILFVYLKILWQSEDKTFFTRKKKKNISPDTTSAIEVVVHSQEFPTSVKLELKMLWTNNIDVDPSLTALCPSWNPSWQIQWQSAGVSQFWKAYEGWRYGQRGQTPDGSLSKRYCWQHRWRNVFVGVQQFHKFCSGNICGISCIFSPLICN